MQTTVPRICGHYPGTESLPDCPDAVLLFLGIFLYPIIRTVIMSFFKIDGVTDSMDLWKFVGFGNYTKLMSTSLFKTSFFNLFRIWLIGGLVVMSLSLLFAVILTSGIRGKKFFR